MGEPVRFAGRITNWNDGKGFGFVMPNGGGDNAFVHVNQFQRTDRRPLSGDLISYVLYRDDRGRLQARQIRFSGQTLPQRKSPSRVPRAILGIVVLCGAIGTAYGGIVPAALAWACIVLSTLSYFMYLFDKQAAGKGAQRIPEASLHLVDLLGGWPGALVAQQQFRHKTIKQPFQTVFWATVAGNIVAVAWLLTSGTASRLLSL